MESIGAVIFDLDGVVVFTDKYHYLAWKVIADRLKIPFDHEVNNLLRGVSRMESLDIILRHGDLKMTDEEKTALAAEKNAYYCDYLKKMTPKDCSDEVRNTMNALRSAGLKLAIGSSSKNAKTILKQIGLENYFDAVSDGTNITRTKPDPEVFLLAAEYMNMPAKECVVVEDAVAGIEAGHNAGMRTIAMRDAKTCPLATWKADRFSEILDVLEIG